MCVVFVPSANSVKKTGHLQLAMHCIFHNCTGKVNPPPINKGVF